MNLWRLHASHTHLYPGARLRCEADRKRRFAAGDRALIAFSDGNVALARIASASPKWARLEVAAHTTVRGAPIVAKSWIVEPAGAEGEMRVRRRVA